jgi:formylglycine-generating enzyme required for sulfatase activity
MQNGYDDQVHGRRHPGLCVALMLLAAGLVVPTFASTGAAAVRGSELIEPLPTEMTAGNAGLFVGIGAFPKPDARLSTLRFAPNDAIALAHLFAIELKLIPPQRAWLALGIGGTNDLSPVARQQLAVLRSAGASVINADKADILGQVSRIARLAGGPEDALLLSFSTHGYEEGGQIYLMPRDGLREFVDATGIPENAIVRTLQRSRAGKRILIIDACREVPGGETRGDEAMSEAFRKAFGAAQGVARLVSCSPAQKSWEAADLQLGVYTHFLIEALRGKAAPDPDTGYILLDGAIRHAAAATDDWVKRHRGARQVPMTLADESARRIPLAVSTRAKITIEVAAARRKAGLDALDAARRADRRQFPASLADVVESASRDWSGSALEELLDQLDLLKANTAAARANFLRYWASVNKPAAEPPPRPVPDPVVQARPSRVPEGFRAEQSDGVESASGLPWTIAHERTGYRLKLVPAGEFMLGSTDWADSQPVRRIHLDAYWIGETEVTCDQFALFLNDKGNQTEGGVTWCGLAGAVKIEQSGSTYRAKAGFGSHPVVELSWYGARAFARWIGGDLPSEPQWEKAAKGGREVLWPWGGTWDRSEANTAERIAGVGEFKTGEEWLKWWEPYQKRVLSDRNDYSDTTVPVKRYRTNGYGLYDMAGNVWEWCLDYYAAEAYKQLRDGQRNPTPVTKGDTQTVEYWQGGEKKTEQQECRVVRGGGWGNLAGSTRCAFRGRYRPASGGADFGVRVVVSPRP